MDLAKELNNALFAIGDDPDCSCVRIAFKGSKDDFGKEKDLGGMCKLSLEKWFREQINKLLLDC